MIFHVQWNLVGRKLVGMILQLLLRFDLLDGAGKLERFVDVKVNGFTLGGR